MDLLFLGTSSGTPTKQRNVTALVLQPENSKHWYLVDCGEGTQHQLLHCSLSLKTLKAVLITHVHGDHCYGLLGLLASASMLGRQEPLTLIAPKAIEEWLKVSCQLTELYLPYTVNFLAVEQLAEWHDDEVQIQPTLLAHRVPSYAYTFIENNIEPSLNTNKLLAEQIPQGQLWGQLKKGLKVEWQGKFLDSQDYLVASRLARKIIVGGDNDTPELLIQACDQAQVLIHEATYTEDIAAKVGAKVQHSSAAIVAKFAQQQQVPHLILTHFSPRYQNNTEQSPSIADIQQEAEQYYQGKLYLAEDFAKYRLTKTGELLSV